MTATVIENLLAHPDFTIVYVPLRTEVDFRTRFLLPQATRVLEIPPRASLDPVMEAMRVRKVTDNKSTVILLPGRTFDAGGTRYGRGGGWYDRFLAHVPVEWTRIGFCFEDQFSQEPLRRQPWDEPMDYVVVVPRAGGSPALYETGARS